MSAIRPLPARPNLDFERKAAKSLLRLLRSGDRAALDRARACENALAAADPAQMRLADAQLVIAREYGFASWPRLVRYFGDVERQRTSYHATIDPPDWYDAKVRALLAEHKQRRASAAVTLAAFVPRFYGWHAADVFAAEVSEAEARLAIARKEGFPSWQVLQEETADHQRRETDDWHVDPMRYAGQAMATADLDELKRVVAAHPELLQPSAYEISKGRSLLRSALHHERRNGAAAMRPIIDWLGTLGLDVRLELNRQLCGHMHMKTDKVRWLIERGADPNWIAPNGIPVLEHALLRYWNGEAVDVLAAHATPRHALWVAAGLGDVDAVSRFLDSRGKPTAAARRLRPDFVAVGPHAMSSHPDPDDEEILLEAFWTAMINGRSEMMEYLAARGFNVNTLIWGGPLIFVAAGNGMTRAVECLIRCGAGLDLRGTQQSGREIARYAFEHVSQDAERRRIVELCGMDPDVILAERAARAQPPVMDSQLEEVLELASDDAFRLGQTEVHPENLLFGLLRSGGRPFMYFTKVSRIDLDRFRSEQKARVRAADDRVEHPPVPLHPDAEAALTAAVAAAAGRQRETVDGLHLLYALMQAEQGAVADLLARYGSSAASARSALERAL